MKLANTSTEVINLLLYAFRSPAALEYIRGVTNPPKNLSKVKIFGLK